MPDILEQRMGTTRAIELKKSINLIVGGYGSGKSEVAVNLARVLAEKRKADGKKIVIVDLDIVNPYFRSREANQILEQLGVEAINPKGASFHADLPIIVPQVKGVVQNNQGTVILDVGGDDVGARVLSSFHSAFGLDNYDMFLVLNANRPFSSDVEKALKLMNEIETSSRLKFTGIISNTHLMDETSMENMLDGLTLANSVSSATGLPVVFVCATTKFINDFEKENIDIPLLELKRMLLKPWELS